MMVFEGGGGGRGVVQGVLLVGWLRSVNKLFTEAHDINGLS